LINFHRLRSHKKHYYYTKAKQWKDEQGYRYIMPFTLANRVIFSSEGCEKAKPLIKKHEITKIPNSNLYELNTCALEYILATECHLLGELWKISNGADIMFFIKLNSGVPSMGNSHVGRIYLGCRADTQGFIKELKNCDDDDSLVSVVDHYRNIITGQVSGVYKGIVRSTVRMKKSC
jgi:hypothetical protein